MSDFELTDFEIVQELSPREDRQHFHAILRERQQSVQLTVFSPEMSQRAEFRRALKTDRAMLMMLQHQSILRYMGSGESGGQLFLCSEMCHFDCLTAQLESGRAFSSEDVIEIGWQICSALQQAHNLGLAHGGLSPDSLLLADNLQVMVIEFSMARWLKAAQKSDDAGASGPALITSSALASRKDVEHDLQSLAAILGTLLQTCPEIQETSEPGRTSTRGPLERLLVRMTSANPALRPVSAREFQGRLGEILIGSDDDSMPLVDQREFTGGSKRSIIVELFEPAESIEQISRPTRTSAPSAWWKQLLPVLIAIWIGFTVAVLAGLFD